MDCKTARLLLEFGRPVAPELDESELDALHAHLADCPECGPTAQVERRADAVIGRAVRAVPLPEGLRDRLREQLRNGRRSALRRRWAWRTTAAGAVAATLLVAVWLGHRGTQPTPLNPEQVGADWFARNLNPSPAGVEHWFRGKGTETVAPPGFDYAKLRYYDLTDLQGRQVPFLLFASGEQEAGIYVLSDRQFDLAQAAASPPVGGSGYTAIIRRHPADAHVAYLIVYTGSSLTPFTGSADV